MVCMNKDKDVVDADSKNKERNDFDDDECRWNMKVTEETDAWRHGTENDQHSAETKSQLGINLKYATDSSS